MTASQVGAPLANYLAARRVGDMLYPSGVIAVDPAARRVVTSYDDLPGSASAALKSLGYITGQISVDVIEAPAVAQSWFVLNRIRELVEAEGGQMRGVFKLLQYFRDLRHLASAGIGGMLPSQASRAARNDARRSG
ncbi:MAG: RidA family protein [Rhodoferax sp.]|nr:RidA family protein [Rhodoferax sp.]